MGDVARYYHASLYAFDSDARTKVITNFNRALGNNVSIRCSYDAESHSFEMECPSVLGFEANEALEREIAAYITKELEAAENENVSRCKEVDH